MAATARVIWLCACVLARPWVGVRVRHLFLLLYILIYILPLAPRWSIGRPQLFSTGFCPGLVVQFGSIAGLFAAVLVRLIFSNSFPAYHGFVYLGVPKKCLFGLPLYGFPSVWPIHLHFFLLIWVVILGCLLGFLLAGPSLLRVFGHLTPRMLRRQRFGKAWIVAEIFFVTLQVSAPYIKTDFTLVLKILFLPSSGISL